MEMENAAKRGVFCIGESLGVANTDNTLFYKKYLTRGIFCGILHINRTDNTEKERRVNGKLNVYEGIVHELKRSIELGVLAQGEKLPSVRIYAVERKVNPNTVAKAYAELEEKGYLRILPKKGAYVCYGEDKKPQNADTEQTIFALKNAGVTLAQIQTAIEKIYEVNADD